MFMGIEDCGLGIQNKTNLFKCSALGDWVNFKMVCNSVVRPPSAESPCRRCQFGCLGTSRLGALPMPEWESA
jgi:hypothetical protein